MTQRVEQSASAIAIGREEPAQAAGESPRGGAARNGTSTLIPLWPQLYQLASEEERASWLAAFSAEGVLYAHRFPGHQNVVAGIPRLLAEILAGRVEGLLSRVPACGNTQKPFDRDLDDAQWDAVCAALSTPDVLLIQGFPGTGKSRTLAEIILQAVSRGDRVLLTAPHASATQTVFNRVSEQDGVVAVHCPEPPSAAGPGAPAASREDLARVADRILERTRTQGAAHLQHRAAALQEAEARRRIAQTLLGLVREWEQLEERRLQTAAQSQVIASDVEKEVQATTTHTADRPLSANMESEAARHQQALADLEQRLQEARTDLAGKQQAVQNWLKQVEVQAQLLEARTSRRYFSWTYWRAFFQGRAEERLAEFRCRAEEAEKALTDAQDHLQAQLAQRECETQRHATAREQIIAHEITRRRSELDQQLAPLLQRQVQILEAWRAWPHPDRLAADTPTTAAAEAIRRTCDEDHRRLSQEHDVAQQWLASLERLAPRFVDHLPPLVNFVAGSWAAVRRDPYMGPYTAHAALFDLVIVDQADRLAEAELFEIARCGKRLVLVGFPPLPVERWRGAAEAGLEAGSALGPFHRLWRGLQGEHRPGGQVWVETAEVLTCQLLPLSPEQHRLVESEKLVDQPDVELRILTLPGGRPILAEVSFALPAFNLARAKTYLYHHLGELILRPEKGPPRWQRGEQKWTLHLASVDAGGAEASIMLEPGVTEVARAIPCTVGSNELPAVRWITTRVEFSQAQGWDRARAQQWLSERAGLQDHDRLRTLGATHRTSHPLARISLEIAGEPPVAAAAEAAPPTTPPLRCIAVTGEATARSPGRAKGSARPPRTHVPAAAVPNHGLEIDLADPRHRQRLPLELQLKLPMRGMVNYLEAQAVVDTLRHLTQSSATKEDHSSGGNGSSQLPEIAVLSFCPAQAQLTELLWHKEAVGAASEVRCHFESTAAFREREADYVLLSLVRSQDGRPVAFASHSDDWRVGLTSARRGLFVFADPAALERRCQTQEVLARQDELLSGYEREVAGRLLVHFQPQAPVLPAPLAREGMAS